MLITDARFEDYGRQLDNLSCALIGGQPVGIADGNTPAAAAQVPQFAHNLFHKRLEKLERQLEFLAAAFPDRSDRLGTYVRRVPAKAHEHGTDDADGFLNWLGQHDVTAEQRDAIECQRTRHTVQRAARNNRDAHLEFTELHSAADAAGLTLTADSPQIIVPNPAMAWAEFSTHALVDDDVELPAVGLFFAVGREIRTAILDSEGRRLLEQLLSTPQQTVRDWCGGSPSSPAAERLEFVQELAEMGIVTLRTAETTV